MDNQKIKNLVQLVNSINLANKDSDIRKVCEILAADFSSSPRLASSIVLHLVDQGYDINQYNEFVNKKVDELSSINQSDIIKLRMINTKLF